MCMCRYIHTYIYTYIHTCTRTELHRYMYVTYIPTYIMSYTYVVPTHVHIDIGTADADGLSTCIYLVS